MSKFNWQSYKNPDEGAEALFRSILNGCESQEVVSALCGEISQEVISLAPSSNRFSSMSDTDTAICSLDKAVEIAAYARDILALYPECQAQMQRLYALVIESRHRQYSNEDRAVDDAARGDRNTYIIRNPVTNDIKIGMSINPGERIKGLGHASGVELEVLAVISEDIERKLHEKFKEYRSHGEWFKDLDGKIVNFARSIKE